jgi:hypothetical protein
VSDDDQNQDGSDESIIDPELFNLPGQFNCSHVKPEEMCGGKRTYGGQPASESGEPFSKLAGRGISTAPKKR